MQELYRSTNLRVFATVPGDSRRERIVVSFANWLPQPSIEVAGAAKGLLEPRGIDALYINCAGNHWWQYEDLPVALAVAADFLAPWRDITTYGSSMGGYAALRFAAALNAHRAVAICPQYSIQRSLMPLETRWAGELASITFRHEGDCEISRSCRYVALYDTLFRLDGMHVDAYRHHTAVTRIPLPCSGHPPIDLLMAYGNLSRVILELLTDSHQPALLRAEHRAKRRESDRYWSELGRRLCERKHYGAMRAAFARCIDLAPTKLHLERAMHSCAAAGLRDEAARYQARLAQVV